MIAWSVVSVTPVSDHRLAVVFADGTSGTVDLSGDTFDGVLSPLADPEFFAQARVVEGVVTWPNGLDLAPDAMYDEVVATKPPKTAAA